MFTITEEEKVFLKDLEDKDFDCRRCIKGCKDCPLDIFCDSLKLGSNDIRELVNNLKKRGSI